MKITLPETLKNSLPQNMWGKVLSATPVVMTIIATMLAGLASSEMTRAQYDRSMAAQRQSKAGDQWNFFQGKKLRGGLQRTTLDLMFSTAEVSPLSREKLLAGLAHSAAGTAFESPVGQQALTALVSAEIPKATDAPELNSSIQSALAALDGSRSDAELVALLAEVEDKALETALRSAQSQALDFDTVVKPIGQVIDLAEKQLSNPEAAADLRRSFIAARLNYTALRYDIEARLNQTIAGLYELQVHRENLSAERHHRRSQKFFYGMLAAQMAVIVATLAMAAQKRSLLWSLAAAAGTIAILFAVYVYLYV